MDEKSKTFKRLGFTERFPMRSEGETKISKMYLREKKSFPAWSEVVSLLIETEQQDINYKKINCQIN